MSEQQLRPVVYVQVEGGIAYICSIGDVEIVLIDWDNYKTDELDGEDIDYLRACVETLRPHAAFALSVPEIEEFIAKREQED